MTSQPGRIVYLNGEFLPEAEARLSIFDRGFLFGDGIYEVTSVLEGKLIDSDLHMARLERSAREIDVPLPVTTKEIVEAERRLIADNNLVEGMIYLQLTRGARPQLPVFRRFETDAGDVHAGQETRRHRRGRGRHSGQIRS